MRLTKRGNAGNALKNCEDCEIKLRESCCSKQLCLNALISKLAAYEDAEEQGRLVILPCKVEDTFFFLSETIHGELYVAQSHVSDIVITGDALMIIDTDGCYHYTYWFTREEAEAALKNLIKKEN